jgi:hypothetical protein
MRDCWRLVPLYTADGGDSTESMNETMFPRQHLPRGNCSPIVHQQIVSSPVQILPDQFDSEKSTFHDAILLFFFFFFFFFGEINQLRFY